MRWRTLVAVALAALAPAARAQEVALRPQETPRAPKVRDVERGFFFGLEAGYLGLTRTPTADPAKFPFAGADGGRAGGLLIGANVGVDLGSRFAFSLYAQGGNERASVNYGAFSVIAAGADLRFAFLALTDRNGFDRVFAYVHTRAGFARTSPSGLFGRDDTIVAVGPGVEYYTHLRHFSIGLAADFVRALTAGANGFAVYPTVRYTF
jgi:hypothetical protein